MAIPNLIFPVDVIVEPIDRSSTLYDEDTREPIYQVKRGTQVILEAQVQWTEYNRGSPGRGGVEHKSSGYLVFRQADLESLGYDPQRGDKIVEIPGFTGAFYMHSFEPAGHRRGRNQLLLAFFSDRQPTRGR